MEEIAESESLDLSEMTLFYYEVFEEEYNDSTHCWEPFQIEKICVAPPNVIAPKEKNSKDLTLFVTGKTPTPDVRHCPVTPCVKKSSSISIAFSIRLTRQKML